MVATFQRAADSAYSNGKRYEIMVDLIEQTYLLREISSGNLEEVYEEEIIDKTDLPELCYIYGFDFDDPEFDSEDSQLDEDTETLIARFRVGPAGWQCGGKILLQDRNNNFYSIMISTLSRVVKLEKGDIPVIQSKRKEEVPF
jgi:hypothetical protein